MQFLAVWMILFSLWICTAPLVYPDTPTSVEQVQNTEVTPSQSQGSPSGSLFQESLTELVREAGIENPLISVRKTAEDAARSVGRSLGQYLRGQYQQLKNEDILQRFDKALAENLAGLQLSVDERRRIVQRIQEDYIQDAESGKLELDQQNFRDLSKIIKKQYAEIELARTVNGTAPTYDNKGFLKTMWTVRQGMLEGPAVTYYSNGEIKYIDLYKNGRKINRKKFDDEGKLSFEQNYDYELAAPTPEINTKPVMPEMPSPTADASPSQEQVNDPNSGMVEVHFKEVKSALRQPPD